MDQHEAGDRPQPEERAALEASGAESCACRAPTVVTRRRVRRWAPMVAAVTVALAGVAFGSGAFSRASTSTLLLSSRSGTVQAGATITVTGSGTVTGKPDTLGFQIGVHSTADSASAALRDNNSVVARLESTLKARGVPPSGMQTSQLDIYANENSMQVITGFSVDDALSVTTHAVSSAGSVIDAAARSAGNGVQMNGISFSISNQSGLLAKARAAAMANARTEASQVAAGAGLTLGGVVRVTDQENSAPQPIYGFSAGMPQASSAKVPLQVGSQPVSVQVSVVYSLQG